jgi:hypothetical protein
MNLLPHQLEELVVEYLQDQNNLGGILYSLIAANIGQDVDKVKEACFALEREGRAIQVRRGAFALIQGEPVFPKDSEPRFLGGFKPEV